MKILIVEDCPMINEMLQNTWPRREDHLKFVSTYAAAANMVRRNDVEDFDGIIAEMKLPDGSGLDILRAIRVRSNLPLILMSGWGDAVNRAEALDLGADDYVMKPFHVRELQARMARIVTARTQARTAARRGCFQFGRVECDLQQRNLSHGGEEVPLTETEARILEMLYEQRNRECTKSSLYRNAFFRTYDPDDKTLVVYIARLREKIGQLDEASAACIQTVRGSGYRYSELRED